MSKKNYDQRLKERWKRKEQKEAYHHKDVTNYYGLKDMFNWTIPYLSFLFGKRNR